MTVVVASVRRALRGRGGPIGLRCLPVAGPDRGSQSRPARLLHLPLHFPVPLPVPPPAAPQPVVPAPVPPAGGDERSPQITLEVPIPGVPDIVIPDEQANGAVEPSAG